MVRRRDALVAVVIAIAAGIAAASPAFGLLHGMSIDALTALRWFAFGPARAPATSPTVIVALDEEAYRTPPFIGTPGVFWTREIGRVVTAVIDGGAKVVGFDVVFPTSIEQSELPFRDETLGAKLRGFDRDFLRALATASQSGKIVLGQVQHQDQPILPSPGQRAAVGHMRNIRALNVYTDRDNVVRRVPLTFEVDGATVPSMAVELAARAQGAAPERTADGAMTLAGYRIPGAVTNTMTLNFEGGADDIPTYSLGDLRACAEKGDTDFFRRHFEGKVVLVGALLDAEDRKLTSKRFATAVEGTRSARCALAAPPAAERFVRDSIAGVAVHATAVNNLIRRDALFEFGPAGSIVAAALFAALAAAAALMLAPVSAALAYLGLAAAWTGGAVLVFRHAVAVPLAEPLIAGLLALGATIGYRFVTADKDKRLLRQSFALYLAPEVIEKLMASRRPPALGGEMRSVTEFFSDLAGFSSFAETMTPRELVALMNTYFAAMTEVIEAHGGFVDKYIGDAIVAVFGAPLDDGDHAVHAVRAAIACGKRLDELNRTTPALKGRGLRCRIGLNTGEALVGNIGSHRRFNYTAMGDTVNLAARLERANKHYATTIMAGETTVSLTGTAFLWRELDAVRVRGRAGSVKVFEPLAAAGEEAVAETTRAAVYAEGLACWRARDFAGAAARFGQIAADDPPARLFLERASAFVRSPPGPGWEPVTVLEGS
ncbi:MAG TPA: adenylate/guanylate cyclase domain-containing protein [Xanthobacteraceae bacterium]|nr:adenylate/guanylate cyclase domain-containing protein [Xanthobacteraceae bacterium]